MIHTGESSHKCKIYDYSCIIKDNMKVHMIKKNLKWRNSYPRRMTTWSCASRWRGREGGKSLAFFNGSSGCLGVLEFIFENFLFKQKFSGRHREMRARARVRWQRKDLLN